MRGLLQEAKGARQSACPRRSRAPDLWVRSVAGPTSAAYTACAAAGAHLDVRPAVQTGVLTGFPRAIRRAAPWTYAPPRRTLSAMSRKGNDSGAITEMDSNARARVSAITPVTLPEARFRDDGQIARGGAGTVHRILDKTLLRRAAMKLLSDQLQRYPNDRQRFIEEA